MSDVEYDLGDIVIHRSSDRIGVITSLNYKKMTDPPVSYDISTDFGVLIENVPTWLFESFTNH